MSTSRVHRRRHSVGFDGDDALSWKFGVMRRRDPAIAAAADSFNKDRILSRIAQRIAQTVDSADDAAIKIHIHALWPESLAHVFPAENFIGTADQQLQSSEG